MLLSLINFSWWTQDTQSRKPRGLMEGFTLLRDDLLYEKEWSLSKWSILKGAEPVRGFVWCLPLWTSETVFVFVCVKKAYMVAYWELIISHSICQFSRSPGVWLLISHMWLGTANPVLMNKCCNRVTVLIPKSAGPTPSSQHISHSSLAGSFYSIETGTCQNVRESIA